MVGMTCLFFALLDFRVTLHRDPRKRDRPQTGEWEGATRPLADAISACSVRAKASSISAVHWGPPKEGEREIAIISVIPRVAELSADGGFVGCFVARLLRDAIPAKRIVLQISVHRLCTTRVEKALIWTLDTRKSLKYSVNARGANIPSSIAKAAAPRSS